MTQNTTVVENPGSAKWHALAATFLGESFDAMDATIYFVALYPALSELLKTTDTVTIGWYGAMILATFMVGWALGSICFGIIADKFGRMHTMTATIVLYALATGCCALSQNWWHLAICRFFVGMGIGGEISIGCVVLSEFWSGRSKLWALSVMQTSFGLGCLLAGFANFGSEAFGWRFLFVAGVAPALITFYIRAKLKEPRCFLELAEKKKALAAQPIAALNEDERLLLANPLRLAFDAANCKKTVVATLLCASSIVGYWAAVSWMPAWINQLTGTEAIAERSSATMYMGIGGIIGTLAAPLLVVRFGYRGAFQLAFLASIVPTMSMFLLVKTYTPAVDLWAFVVGFGSSMPFMIAGVYLTVIFSTHLLGTASGIAWGVGRIITAMVAVCTGPIISFFDGSYAMAAAAVALVYVVGFLMAFFVTEPAAENSFAQ